MQDVIKRFYNYIVAVQRYSENTKQSYQNDVDSFASFLSITYQIHSINEISHFHIRSWIVKQMEAGLTVRSINRKISALSTFFKYLKRFEGLESDPLKKIVRPKASKRLPITVPKNDLVHPILKDVDTNASYSKVMEEMLILLLYSTGIRRSEIINLKESDLDKERMVLRIFGKGKKERYIPVNSTLVEKMETFIAFKHRCINEIVNENIFLTESGKPLYPKMVYNIVNRFLNTIPNLERRSPHILRHTFATHLVDAGADINAVKMLLGHSSLAATQVYMHSSAERLKAVYQNAHPRSGKE